MLQILQLVAWRIDCRGNTEKAKKGQILQKALEGSCRATYPRRLPTAHRKSIRWCAATTTPSTGALFRVAGRHVAVAMLDLVLEDMKTLGLSRQNLDGLRWFTLVYVGLRWFMLVYFGLSFIFPYFFHLAIFESQFDDAAPRQEGSCQPLRRVLNSVVGCCFSARWQHDDVTQNLCEPWAQSQFFVYVWFFDC